jgi:pimeloyl-ACP methyl ester carboxylesterase
MRPGRRFALATIAALVLLLGAYAVATWYYSERINSGGLQVDRGPEDYDVEVIAVGGESITLKGGSPEEQPEFVGLEWPGGYARADGLNAIDGDIATRGFALVSGELVVGANVRYDTHAWCCDPGAVGLEFTQIILSTELGDLDAWAVESGSASWVVFIHGKDSDRTQGLRLLPTLVGAGWNVLLTTYRNHESSPAGPGNRHNYGLTEWRDLEAAVQFVQNLGAERLVIAGWSMGGATSLVFMRESAQAIDIDGLILSSPLLDFEGAVDYGAQQLSLPGFLTTSAKWLADRRFGIDWNAMDYREIASQLDLPMLLIHGSADDTIPVTASQSFGETYIGPITYVEFAGADHTALWNSDPALFEETVDAFMDALP